MSQPPPAFPPKTKTKIGVLALHGSFAEHCAHVRRCGGEPVEVRKAEQLVGCSGLIIPGGEVRSYSHWFPYDRVGVVNADP